MKKRYSLITPKVPGNVALLDYNLEGKLMSITFNEDCEPTWIEKIGRSMPVYDQLLKSEFFKGCQIKDITYIDLSFPVFWNHYNYKVGNKKRVEKRWNELDDQEKILALGYVRRYRRWCLRKRIDFCYPETYINQRRWENIID